MASNSWWSQVKSEPFTTIAWAKAIESANEILYVAFNLPAWTKTTSSNSQI
jgi:hypothetical protein